MDKKSPKDSTDNEEASPKLQDIFDPVTMTFKTATNSVKKSRQKKGEYQKKLEDDNSKLKDLIVQIWNHINTVEAQNSALRQQLNFFQGCLPPASASTPNDTSTHESNPK